MSKDINSLTNPHVAAMSPYTPGLQPTEPGWVKLNTNELPVPPSPMVSEAIRQALVDDGRQLRLYPNPTSAPLRLAVAEHHGLDPSNVLIGNGADDVLNLLIRVFCGTDRACGMTVPSYSLYSVLTTAQNAEMKTVQFEKGFELPSDGIIQSGTNLFLLTCPNAPSGIGFSMDTIEHLASNYGGILAIDETYAPFASENAVELLNRHPKLAIVRSFSKAYALAGMRIGYVLASPEVISLLDRVRDSYNVDRLAQVAGLVALSDQPYYKVVIEDTIAMRQHMHHWYSSLGWHAFESAANYHLVEPRNKSGEASKEIAGELYNFLLERKILVRCFPNHPLTETRLRISLGSESEMATLKKAIEGWLET